jgi:hypothetical protein
MVAWLLESFPQTADISNSNGDQVVHFAAAEGKYEQYEWEECMQLRRIVV